MKLYIDVGNTSTSLYIDNAGSVQKVNVKTYKNVSIVNAIEKKLNKYNIDTAFLTSVVPEVDEYILKILELKQIKTLYFSHEYFETICKYEPIPTTQMGADRVIVDSASINLYGDNVIVIDLGTAVTVDVILKRQYITGYIYPGLVTSMDALIKNASKLSAIKFKNIQPDSICLDTEKQINDGLIIGLLGSMSKLIEVSSSHYKDLDFKVIITGGFFNMIVELIGIDKTNEIMNCDYVYDRDLIIKGMQILEDLIKE